MQLVTRTNSALTHATACGGLLESGGVAEAVRYCLAQGIEPPIPACTRSDPQHARYLEIAESTLSQYGWWQKRLKIRHARLATSRR